MKDICIAAVVFNGFGLNPGQNIKRMIPFVKSAKDKGARIILFPEMNITGYSSGPEIKDIAEPVPGPISEKLSDMAVKEGMVILGGMAEKDDKDHIYISHIVAGPDGLAQVYRKIHMAPPEKNMFTGGDNVPVFSYFGVKFGIQLCYDAHFPELSTIMAQKGADVLLIAHASPKGNSREKYKSWMRHLPARAFDNSLFVIACNQTGENQNGLFFPGIALSIDPSGNVIDKYLSPDEGILLTNLSANALLRVRNHKMRFFFPNRRPKLYGRIQSGFETKPAI